MPLLRCDGIALEASACRFFVLLWNANPVHSRCCLSPLFVVAVVVVVVAVVFVGWAVRPAATWKAEEAAAD
jgi:hypothetical protein